MSEGKEVRAEQFPQLVVKFHPLDKSSAGKEVKAEQRYHA